MPCEALRQNTHSINRKLKRRQILKKPLRRVHLQQCTNGLFHYQFAVQGFFLLQVRVLNAAVVEWVDTFFDGQQPVEVFQQPVKDDAPFHSISCRGYQFAEILAVVSSQGFTGRVTLDQGVQRQVVEHDAAQVFTQFAFEGVIDLWPAAVQAHCELHGALGQPLTLAPLELGKVLEQWRLTAMRADLSYQFHEQPGRAG